MFDEEYQGGKIECFEVLGMCAVQFLLGGYLDRGFNFISMYDTLGKNAGEYLRAK
jgi:hypothetical protein